MATARRELFLNPYLQPVLEVLWPILKFCIPLALVVAAIQALFKFLNGKSPPSKARPKRKHLASERGRRAREKGLASEQELKELLEAEGHQVQLTPAHGDFGTDLLVTMTERRYAIQCKNTWWPVKEDVVQQTHGGKLCYKCDAAILASTGGVTPEAKLLADRLGIQVWDWVTISALRRKHGRVPPDAVPRPR
jgi:HJR/Mrr/RecB family endonuclease